MGKVTIKDIDLGMKKIFRELEEDAKYVDIGVQSDESEQLLIIAGANEFGTENIPARPFIRSTVDQLEDKYADKTKRLAGSLLDGRLSKREALSLLGQIVEGDIKNTIVTLREPPNDPSTVKKKGSDNPLVDTGLLGGSIRYIVKS